MTLSEATARLSERANGVMTGDDLRAIARDLYGKSTDRDVSRLIREAGFLRIATAEGGRPSLDPAYLALLRRDVRGAISLDGIDLLEGPDVVAVEDGARRWHIAPQGAVMRLNHWLAEKMTIAAE